MTVKELIALLEDQNPDEEVCIWTQHGLKSIDEDDGVGRFGDVVYIQGKSEDGEEEEEDDDE